MSPRANNAHQRGEGGRWADSVRAGSLVALVGLAYGHSFGGAFVFDDLYRIVENDGIRTLWPPWGWLAAERPVVELTLAVNYALGGLDVWGYHAFNVGVHVLAALTLYGVLRRTIHDDRSTWLAWAMAALWAVHPLQTQSVTYIIQRGESLMGFFYLLTLYCFIRGRDSQRRHLLWYVAAVGSCALGMGSKGVMVTAPVIVALYDVVFAWPQGNRGHGSPTEPVVVPVATAPGSDESTRGGHRRRWGVYIALAATWVVLWACGVTGAVLDPHAPNSGVGFSVPGTTPCEYALTQAGVLLKYLQLGILPVRLCLDYDWPVTATLGAALPALAAVSILLITTVVGLLRRSWWGFAGAWFFGILAPTSSFVPIKDPIFEHRMYLPLAAVIAVVVIGARGVVRSALARMGTCPFWRGAWQAALALLAIATLAYGTVERNKVYESELTVWRDVTVKRPHNARAWVALGSALLSRDRVEESVAACREAIRLRPDLADAHVALGLGLARRGETSAAVAEYGEAIRLTPNHAKAYYNLGNALSREGKLEEAVDAYRRSLAINPRFADAHCNLGNVLARRQRWEEAIAAYHEALRVDPGMAKAYNNLGDALRQMGRLAEAVEQFQRAVEVELIYANAHANLAAGYLDTGQYESAVRHAREALRLDPNHPTAQMVLDDASAMMPSAGRP